MPDLGAIQLDKLTATRIAAHYRQLETSGLLNPEASYHWRRIGDSNP